MSRAGILIVDDEKKILETLRVLLEGDYDVFTAPSTEAAKEILRSGNVHVVISDFRMPGQDGLSFLVELKEKRPEITRVLMTGYGDMDLVIRATNEGEVHRFVSKPYRAAEMVKIIRECVALSEAAVPPGKTAVQDRTVLIAHDSNITLSMLQMVMGRICRVITTSHGMEVVSIVGNRKLDAVVVGIGLEMLDGCSITTYLKKERKVPYPVIVWSRDIGEPLERYLNECGADLVIDEKKPEAASRLRAYLQKKFA